MDRSFVYPGSIPQDTDILSTNKQAMIALGKLAGALFGSGGIVNGLVVAPQSPASLSVNVGPGEIYQLENIDNSPYGSIAADTSDTVIKQGIQLGTVALACPAPNTSGYSINYLIEAVFQENDINNVVLPYYNAANPAQAYAGPNNTGQAQATTRADQVTVTAKAGVAATTGNQTTPAVDAGHIPLAVVTVAYGQATITSSNIAIASGSLALPSNVLGLLQTMGATYALDTGSANTYAVAYRPALSALVDGMRLTFKAANSNTGASTLAVNGLTAYPVVGYTGAALTSGQIAAGSYVEVVWNATLSNFMLSSNPVAAGGSGTVTQVTLTTANGVSATVANQGTTPALTVTLGAITPSSVAATGAISCATLNVTG